MNYKARYNEIIEQVDILNNEYLTIPNNTPEEEFDKIEAEINTLNEKARICLDADWDSKTKEISNINNWTKDFINSFTDCHKKKISIKQANVFERILYHDESKYDYCSFSSKSYVSYTLYHGLYNDKIYELKLFSNCGYLTIRDKITL